MADNFTAEELENFQQQFNVFDVDLNGHITVDELKKVMEALGEDGNVVNLAKIIAEIDTDKSGTIEFEEFLTVLSKMRQGKNTSQFGKMLNAKSAILEKMRQAQPPPEMKAKKTWKVDSNKSTSEGKYKAGMKMPKPEGAPPPKKSLTDLP